MHNAIEMKNTPHIKPIDLEWDNMEFTAQHPEIAAPAPPTSWPVINETANKRFAQE
jgi:hypothetical protein